MQTSMHGRKRRPAARAVTALVGALVLMLGIASPAAAQADLEPGEIASSRNLRLVHNIPRTGVSANDIHSDLAFHGDLLIQGTYGGLNFYDISRPLQPKLIQQIACPGGQGDPTVSPDGTLVFMSVDAPRSDSSCNSSSSSAANPDAWEGVRIFDISDLSNPQYVAAVRTDCGSHTHTLVPGETDDVLYLYVSSYGPNANFPNCQPPHDSISIIEVPLDDPASASVIAKPNLFPDGGAPGTAGCHDITVVPELEIAGGACMGEGVLLNISDPTDPYVIERVTDPNFAFWHSATFSNDFSKVIFTDELGGGSAATCREDLYPERGADAIFDIVGEGDDRELVFRSYFKIPRHQTNQENCVAHNGSIIPVDGRDLFVQSWYQGGVSVIDFTDSDNPVEIAWFDRGRLQPQQLGGSWSAYWYNGYIYSSDITQGLDVLRFFGDGDVAQARRIELDHFNAQT